MLIFLMWGWKQGGLVKNRVILHWKESQQKVPRDNTAPISITQLPPEHTHTFNFSQLLPKWRAAWETHREWKMSICVGSTWPLIFSDIYSHSWAQGWPAPPVVDAEDKCQPHPLEASYAYMHIGNQIHLAYHTLRLECPSFRRALIALCHPTSHHHLMELEKGRTVYCIFNQSKRPTKLDSFHITCL